MSPSSKVLGSEESGGLLNELSLIELSYTFRKENHQGHHTVPIPYHIDSGEL